MNKIVLKQNVIKEGSEDYLGDYLRSLGIPERNIDSLLDFPASEDEDDGLMLENIENGVAIIKDALINHRHVHVVVDSDCDGYTSAAQMVYWLKNKGVECTYSLHPGKEHGIVLADIPEGTETVIVPDAGTNDVQQIEALLNKNIKVLIIDHHLQENKMPEKYSENRNWAILNNQISPRFENKYLSGAGMVNIFLKTVDQIMDFTPIHIKMRDLAAIGIIADAMNMTSLGNNFLAYYGLRNINNKFIKALAAKQSHGIKDPSNLTKTDVSFYIAPVINGVIRSGTEEDKKMVFRALWDQDCALKFSSVWRGIERMEDLYNYAARLATNAKNRQDSAKKKSFEWLCGEVKENHDDDHNLLIVKIPPNDAAKINPNITGLIAMELTKEFNKPTLVVKKTSYNGEEVYGGSGRNGKFYGLPNLMDFLNKSDLCEAVVGHANAFGVFLKEDNIDLLREYSDDNLDKSCFDPVYEVDYWFKDSDKLNKTMLSAFASREDLYGNSIPQPLFAIERVLSPADVHIMGKDKSSIKLSCGEISLVGFKHSDWAAKLSSIQKNFKITCVGRPQNNEWMGKTSIQIIMEDLIIDDTQDNLVLSPTETKEDKPAEKPSLMDLI